MKNEMRKFIDIVENAGNTAEFEIRFHETVDNLLAFLQPYSHLTMEVNSVIDIYVEGEQSSFDDDNYGRENYQSVEVNIYPFLASGEVVFEVDRDSRRGWGINFRTVSELIVFLEKHRGLKIVTTEGDDLETDAKSRYSSAKYDRRSGSEYLSGYEGFSAKITVSPGNSDGHDVLFFNINRD